MFIVEIIPKLCIGTKESLKLNNSINCVINCQSDLQFLDNYKNYRNGNGIRENLEKYEIIKMYEYLNESCDYIYNNLLNNKEILVYCENGNQKSATVACAFLIKYGKMLKDDAIFAIRTKHKTAFYPSITYETSLEMMENSM
jgi:protein-tyrosine phosphatase